MEEIWIDIKDYEGLYQVSNFGRIKSLPRHKIKTDKILKTCKNIWGYLYVSLCKDAIVKKYKVHRLVAECFLPNPDNLPQVNHKDECKTNNFVFINNDGTVDLDKSNLEWCTPSYNVNYGTRNKRVSYKMKKESA